jgi:hypothetical protein
MSCHAFVLIAGEADAYGRIYGPQGKSFAALGRTPDGRTIGVAEVYPSELAIIASPAHEGEYLGSRWEELLHGPHADDVDWMVAVADPEAPDGERWVGADEAETEALTVLTTEAGNLRRRPPVPLAEAETFDPDWMPPVGTIRVVELEGADDRVQVVRSGADGARQWVDLAVTTHP